MYMLISVFEREILTEQFDTLEEAHARMMEELKEDFDKDDWDEVANETLCDDYEDFGFGIDWAWSNLDDDCNCDWKIVEIQ